MKAIKHTWIWLLLLLSCGNLLAQNDPAVTLKKIDSLKLDLQASKEDSNKVKTLIRLAETYFWGGPPLSFQDSSIKYTKLALLLTDKVLCNPALKGKALNMLGVMYSSSNPPEGLKYYFAALKIWQASGHKPGIGASFHNIANIYEFHMGNNDEALKYNLAALEIRKKTSNKNNLQASYFNIANNYYNMGRYNDALKYYFTGLETDEENMSKRSIAYAHNSIGICYAQMGKYDESLSYLFPALKTFNELKDKLGLARSLINIGICNAKRASSLPEPEARAKYSEALEYLNKGLFLTTREVMHYRRDAYSGLAKIYMELKDFEKAVDYTNRYTSLNDSILNKETQNRIDQLRIEYETEQATTQERVNNEKFLIAEKARQAVVLAEEKALRQKLIGDQKLQQERTLAEEKILHEVAIAEQKFQQDKLLAEQKAKHDKSIALAKMKEEKLRSDKRKMNSMLLIGIFGVTIISGLLFLLIRQRNLKKRAIERADAIRKMTELELQSLRTQLNPHFMFNSLNAIQELILIEDNERSHKYLSRFSKLVRILLENANQPFISLKKEIDFLELYLSLENLRIPDLEYFIEIDPKVDVENLMIPNMILQPYIENAIWHGLSHKQNNRKLNIRIKQKQQTVIFEIEDNGVGRQKSAELKRLYRKEHSSKGMELLSKRFHLLAKEYGTNIESTIIDLIRDGVAAGTTVQIILANILFEHTKKSNLDKSYHN